MWLKNRSLVLLLVFPLAAVSACSSSTGNGSEDDFKTNLQMGTGNPGGVYFPMGSQYSNIFEDVIDVDDLQVSSIETGASVENLSKIGRGELQLGLAQSNTAIQAVNGEGEFEGAEISNLGLLGSLYPEALHVITLKNSGIDSIDDLEGKRVTIGPPGSGSQSAAKILLDSYGIESDDYTPMQESFDDAKRKLQDGNADASIEIMGVPYSGIQELDATQDVKLIPIDESKVDAIVDETDFVSYEISEDSYDFLEKPLPTFSVFSSMFASTDQVSEDLAYEMTKAIYERADDITLPQSEAIKLENALLGRGDVPLHPGAKKYFSEAGILDED